MAIITNREQIDVHAPVWVVRTTKMLNYKKAYEFALFDDEAEAVVYRNEHPRQHVFLVEMYQTLGQFVSDEMLASSCRVVM